MRRQIMKIILVMMVCAIAAYLMVRCCVSRPTSQIEAITTDPPIIVPMMPSCCTKEVSTEEITTETTTEAETTTEVMTTTVEELYYDIPLPEYLQTYTIEVCREYNINPLVIFAMMEVESLYTIDIIGDNGNAVGILQVHPRWHQERANKLKANLYDVEGNILVAVDLLAELLDKYDNYGLAITAYNRGTASEISEYGKKVLKIASTIEIKN